MLDKKVKVFSSANSLNEWYQSNHNLKDYRIISFNDKGQILVILHPVHLNRLINSLTKSQQQAIKNNDTKSIAKYTKLLVKANKRAEDEDYDGNY